ncbi:MAG: TrkH family potassium uptake protein [Parasporobacterium sp.]|nr:TrkH family potassium uptake protein [Parasporobacterium sp.]
MNIRLILKTMGLIMIIEAAAMLLPMAVDLIYLEGMWGYFFTTSVALGAAGALLYFFVHPKKNTLYQRDGYLIVALAWLVLSLAGALPFAVSGSTPSYLDAVFETVSGFTTTGSTVLADVEVLSHSMLFWRSFTHWLGGMGILVFMLTISTVAGKGSAMHLMRAESPGPVTEKMTPKLVTTARYLYLIYGAMTVIQVIALVIAGLPLFESILVSFGTLATGGFAFLNSSLATFTYAQQTIVTVFMLLSGVNFGLYYLLCTRKPKNMLKAIKNEELWWYLGIVAAVFLATSLNTYASGTFDTFGDAAHHSIFSVASIITTTGYSTVDMPALPWFSKAVLLMLMYVGGCAGSTAGGIKVSRIAIGFKAVKNYLKGVMHPRRVSSTRFERKEISDDVIRSVLLYIIITVMFAVGSIIIVSFDPIGNFSVSASAVATTLNNNGVALDSACGSFF